jgi:hypothetical protein
LTRSDAPLEPRLPLSKLGGVPPAYRRALKSRRITSCGQLLQVAATPAQRQALASATGLDPDGLLTLARWADMARVTGIGVIFGVMLEKLGVIDVAGLSARDPVELQEQLRQLNHDERMARRAPTLEEVADWVAQAGALPPVVR